MWYSVFNNEQNITSNGDYNMAKRIITEEDSVYVDCDFYNAGMTEDGEDFVAESYFVVVQRLDGHRLAHAKVFLGCEAGIIDDDDEGQFNGLPYFGDVRKEAKEAADNLVARIMEVGTIDTDHWFVAEPSYGAEAYCSKYGF